MVLCDQWCGTAVTWINGVLVNKRDKKPHICTMAQRAREFEGYYNMIQIKRVRERLEAIRAAYFALSDKLVALNNEVVNLNNTLDWQENQNKPLAEAFEERKQKGRARNFHEQ